MSRHLVPSKHGMTVTTAVANANREIDRQIRAGTICECCGRPFSVQRPKATNPAHVGACNECSASL